MKGDFDDVSQHLHRVFFVDLQVCECQHATESIELIHEILKLMPLWEDSRWERLPDLIGNWGSVQLVLSMLTNADLITHGGGLSGSWLEPKGEWLLAALNEYPELSEDDFSSQCPHENCDPCTDECWVIPDEWPPDPHRNDD